MKLSTLAKTIVIVLVGAVDVKAATGEYYAGPSRYGSSPVSAPCKQYPSVPVVLSCNLPVGTFIETQNYDWDYKQLANPLGYSQQGATTAAVLRYLDTHEAMDPLDASTISVKCNTTGILTHISSPGPSQRYKYDTIICNTPTPSCEKSSDSNDQFNCQMDSNITVTCPNKDPNKEFHVTYFRPQDDMLMCQDETGTREAINVSYGSGSGLKPFTTGDNGIVKCITNGDLGYWQGTVDKPSGNFKCFIDSTQAQAIGAYGRHYLS